MREGVFIPLADGTRLAARIWLPEDADADPVPAVLEYLPYRLNDGTASGDHQQMSYFAGCGYAGVRVDIRGSGESDGVLPDEYTEQEQADCLEVIAWLAEQPWCTGAVGMMGYSWSGFNALQMAALRPPALKAIMSGYASDDRYADDVHYRGGLVAPMEMVHWSTCMHGWQARPPDPEIVGDRWRSMWLERLEQAPWIEHWLAHQRRDAYWQQGSVRDDYARIECPVLCVAGWTDGYSDAALRLLEGLAGPRRALIGPWGHNDPVHGVPGPAVGILDELVRWWDRWLKGVDSGIDGDPMLVAYLQDPVQPAANLAERPGRFVGEATWPSPQHLRARVRARRRHARCAVRRGHALDRQRPDHRARGRRLVRRRALGRSAARSARRGLALADVRLRAALRAARAARLRRGAAVARAPIAPSRSSRCGSARCSRAARRCS